MSHDLAAVLIVTLIVGGLTAIVGMVKMFNDRGNRWRNVFLLGMLLVGAAKITSIIVIG